MSKSITRKRCESSGVAGSKLKCPKPAPWIWTTGSPSPVMRCQSLTSPTWINPSTVVASRCRSLRRATILARFRGSRYRAIARSTASASSGERASDAFPRSSSFT